MPITLIQQNPKFDKKVEGENKLAISEMFCNTIQGEGVYTGVPATFIRLQGCTLKCGWCDTLDVWPNGNEYSFDEVFDMLETTPNVLYQMKLRYQHLVLTGGSPLKQQGRLVNFLIAWEKRFSFMPFIELENECVLYPGTFLVNTVNCWNNSPKLSNSGMKERSRIKPDLLQEMNNLKNSWFKFVVSNAQDTIEIVRDFMPYISKEKIILMPCGATQEELNNVRETVADLAVYYGFRYTDRAHVTIWNKKTGV